MNRVVASILVVGLPSGDRWVFPKTLRQSRHDSFTFSSIGDMRKAIVAPGTESSRQTARIDGQHIGHLIYQPFRRSGCRRAEDNRKLPLSREIQNRLHPLEPIFPRVRFESAPGKLADAYKTNADIAHCIEVGRPSFWYPMFRIVTDTERSRRTRVRAWLHRPPF